MRSWKFEESQARKYLAEILGAVKYVHGKFIIHRDIKLDNVIVD